MRVAVAGLALESVSFLPDCVTRAEMERITLRGQAMLDGLRHTASPGGGMIEELAREGADIVPILYADAFAAGPLEDTGFVAYRDELVDGFARAAADGAEGAVLFLHGAMTTPTIPDADTRLLAAIREAFGPKRPLTVALDMHGNITPEMAGLADGLFGFHYSPHVDVAETGARAAHALSRMLAGELRPRTVIRKVPLVLPSIMTATRLQPLADIKAEGFRLERAHAGIVDLSIFTGFAYADVPQIGFSVAAVADGDPGPAERACEALAARIWDERQVMLHAEPVYGLAEGLDRAMAIARGQGGPVVVLEHADRLADSTHGLRAVLAMDHGRVAVPYLYDPKAAAEAVAAGEGADVRIDVGGWSSDRAGGPVELTGRVTYAGHKTYIGTGPMRRGRKIDLGPSAVIDTGRVVVSIIGHPAAAIDRDPFDQFGLDPAAFDLVLLRSKTHFRAVWEELARAIVIVDTPDWGTADLASLPYRHARKGVVPIDAA